MSTKQKTTKAALSAEQRTLCVKQQLLTEQLVVDDGLIKSIVDHVGVPLDQTTIDDIQQVSCYRLNDTRQLRLF